MEGILYIIVTFAFILNLSCPSELTNTNAIALILEYLGVLFLSNYIIRNKLKADRKNKERYLVFFLLGFIISLLYLHFVWTPNLPENSKDWGFDPQRYYLFSSTIAKGELLLTGLNYFGIVYLYAFLFNILGINPLIPLFFNVLISLYAIVVISNHLSRFGGKYEYLAFLLLIPEVIYFNTISSREIICMALASICIVDGYQIINKERKGIKIMPSVFCLLLLMLVRPPMGGGVVISIIFYLFFSKTSKKNIIRNFLFIGVLVVVIIQGLSLSNTLGNEGTSTETALSDAVTDRFSGDNEASATGQYNNNSIAQRLIPHNPVEFVVFGVIRSFAYVIVPPSAVLSPLETFSISKPTTEGFATLTVVFMMFFLPIIYRIIRRKNKPDGIKIILLTLVFFFFFVGVFNTNMIHQRYRVVYDLFYFSIIAYYFSIKKKSY